MKRAPSLHSFQAVAWDEIAARLHEMADEHAEFGHIAAVADSVIASGVADQLAGCTSMHDLLVVPTPVPEPVDEMIRVCSPSSMKSVGDGLVLIEHVTETGHDDRVKRPVAETVPLFWRFVTEKYGVRPAPRD
jgi:hypothetical protein